MRDCSRFLQIGSHIVTQNRFDCGFLFIFLIPLYKINNYYVGILDTYSKHCRVILNDTVILLYIHVPLLFWLLMLTACL